MNREIWQEVIVWYRHHTGDPHWETGDDDEDSRTVIMSDLLAVMMSHIKTVEQQNQEMLEALKRCVKDCRRAMNQDGRPINGYFFEDRESELLALIAKIEGQR